MPRERAPWVGVCDRAIHSPSERQPDVGVPRKLTESIPPTHWDRPIRRQKESELRHPYRSTTLAGNLSKRDGANEQYLFSLVCVLGIFTISYQYIQRSSCRKRPYQYKLFLNALFRTPPSAVRCCLVHSCVHAPASDLLAS